ncbi:hypothetical protein L6452_24352 [Arctium lappa]|uniref:Uncharacterized protein n=1 Tax=Arctium lappa TaxID=4217 RepID=A0ACB9A9M4_ARCLA|nr:hypothetical protein L6452_24352 [Arctium lappa]
MQVCKSIQIESSQRVSWFPQGVFHSRKERRNMALSLWRVKLLSPLFEELKDSGEQLDDDDVEGLQSLKIALNLALQLLKSVNEGSKIFQVTI